MLVGTVLGGMRGWAFTTLLGDMKDTLGGMWVMCPCMMGTK